MIKFENMDYDRQKELAQLFANWLKNYTHEVIVRVMKQRDEIINNNFAIMMLEELYIREEAEAKDFAHSIGNMLHDFETFGQYDPHNHALSHAQSYRDVLHDMYIKKKEVD